MFIEITCIGRLNVNTRSNHEPERMIVNTDEINAVTVEGDGCIIHLRGSRGLRVTERYEWLASELGARTVGRKGK